jgi:hypothetical protein
MNLDPKTTPRPMTKNEKKLRAKVAGEVFSRRMNDGDIQGSGRNGKLTVHDFRKVVTCCICDGIGYDLPRIEAKLGKKGQVLEAKYAHADCFIIERGLRAYLDLPRDEAFKCSLADVGPRVMTAIVNMPEKAKPRLW